MGTLLEELADRVDIQDLANEGRLSAADLDHMSPDDLLSLYLAEMSREALLTAEQEVTLAQRIETGRRVQRAIKETDYTADEYARLQAHVREGQAASGHAA